MRLLLCAAAYPPSVGGVQTLSARLAGALAGRENEVWVLARGREGDPVLDAETAPARVRRVGWKPLLWPALAGRLLALRPDGVLLTHRADFLRPALCARALGGPPVVVVVHGNEVYGSPRAGALIGALARADAVVAVSRYARGRLVEMGLPPERTFAIPNGVSPEALDPPGAGEEVRRRLGLEGRKIILSVGRLVRVKGFDAVIRALPRVLEGEPRAAYVIVGEGPEGEALRGLAREMGVEARVTFLGEVPLAQMGRGAHAYYQACDVFAMPSREDPGGGDAEAFGIAHLEAGAAGKPVVGGRSGGSGEAVAEGESGLLVEADRTEEVAGALLQILTRPELARAMGEAGRRRAGERSWSRVAEEYEAVMRRAADG
ncbi:MAG: glycosyltransferase family 4 protein [bacterium]